MNNAILTNTPEGAAIKRQLLETADFKGHIIVVVRCPYTGRIDYSTFHEIAHYFGPDMRELGMIGFPDSSVETVLLFDPPRKWDEAIIARSSIRKNFSKLDLTTP